MSRSFPVVEPLAALRELSGAFRESRVMQVAARAGIFDAFDEGPAAAPDVARRCGCDPAMAGRLLVALEAVGLLVCEGGSYRPSPSADLFLRCGSALYQGHSLLLLSREWAFWSELEALVKGRAGAHDSSGADVRVDGARKEENREEREKELDVLEEFALAMHEYAACGQARWLARTVDLGDRKRLLDVGGGPGTYSVAFCRAYPRLRATVLDRPEAVRVGRRTTAALREGDRVSFVEGDWNADEFGEGYDCALLSNVLHGRDVEDALDRLARTRRALVGDALLVIHEPLLHDDGDGPLFPALFNLMVGVWTVDELIDLVRRSGFVDPRLHAVCGFASQNSVVVAEAPLGERGAQRRV